MNEIKNEYERGFSEGRLYERKTIAQDMFSLGSDYKFVKMCTGLDDETLISLQSVCCEA